MDAPAGFDHVRQGRDEWLVRASLRESLSVVIRDAFTNLADYAATPVQGGRGGAVSLRLDALALAVRPYRRGGVPGRWLHDTYCWCGGPPRPFRELIVTETLLRRGVPVVEPVAAGVRWIGGIRYRGVMMTRWIEHATSLWQLLRSEADESRRREALRASGAAIARLHAVGAVHADLNLNNMLVRDGEAWLLDFDRGRLRATPAQQRRALARLRRSARKLDPSGAVVRAEDLGLLTGEEASG